MSVILYNPNEVYKDMANAYESLKFLLDERGERQEELDSKFYGALRYLYFANVAAWLATYHDDTPLSPSELAEIEPFEIDRGHRDYAGNHLFSLHKIARAWSRLNYNLVTNGGEQYRPVKAYEFMQYFIERLTYVVLTQSQQKEEIA